MCNPLMISHSVLSKDSMIIAYNSWNGNTGIGMVTLSTEPLSILISGDQPVTIAVEGVLKHSLTNNTIYSSNFL